MKSPIKAAGSAFNSVMSLIDTAAGAGNDVAEGWGAMAQDYKQRATADSRFKTAKRVAKIKAKAAEKGIDLTLTVDELFTDVKKPARKRAA